jgi:regulatory protein YycH of two-component signal transduction system YycFG
MNLERLDLEKYEVLEQERSNTFADTGFQQWVSQLNISQSYEDREGILRANEINNQYDYSNLAGNKSTKFSVSSILSLFK